MEEQNRNAAWREALRKTKNPKERAAIERVKMSELSGDYRSHNSEEVNQGLTVEQARRHAASTAKIRSALRAVLSVSIFPDLSKISNAANFCKPPKC